MNNGHKRWDELSKFTTENWMGTVDLIPDDNPSGEYIRSKGFDPKIIFSSSEEFGEFLLGEIESMIELLKKLYDFDPSIFKCEYCDEQLDYPISHSYPSCPNQCGECR